MDSTTSSKPAQSGGGRILCCLCGTSIIPNEAAMCIECLRSQFDITDVIAKSCEIVQCRKCERWNTAKDHWVNHDLESAGLLACCLKHIHGLQKTKLIDAKWIWTEPHSKRLKILVTVERGVLDDKITLRQNATVEFVVKNKQCLPCIREATDHTWGALVQLRQKVGHKRSLYNLESAMIKAGLHNAMINIVQARDGLDIYFKARNIADKVVEFVSNRIPTKTKTSQKLISQDLNSNTSRMEFTIHAEIAPLCRGDLVVTDKALTGGAEVMIVTKLSSGIYLLNPLTMHSVIVSASRYFMKPFTPLLTMNHLISFVVIDITPLDARARTASWSGSGSSSAAAAATGGAENNAKDSWFQHAEAQVCRESDLGENDTVFTVLTHLGRVLQAGDTVLGYDLQHTLVDDSKLEGLTYDCPDIILIRKSYPDNRKVVKKTSKKGAGKKAAAAVSEEEEPTTAAAGADGEEGATDVELMDNIFSTDMNDEAIEELNALLLDEAALRHELKVMGHNDHVAGSPEEAATDISDVMLELAKEEEQENVAVNEEGGNA